MRSTPNQNVASPTSYTLRILGPTQIIKHTLQSLKCTSSRVPRNQPPQAFGQQTPMDWLQLALKLHTHSLDRSTSFKWPHGWQNELILTGSLRVMNPEASTASAKSFSDESNSLPKESGGAQRRAGSHCTRVASRRENQLLPVVSGYSW